MAERYTYRSLDKERSEIRLLAFEPNSHLLDDPQPSPIRCSVKYVSLTDDTAPPYNAVSYCWGESRALRQIFLDGRLHEVPLSADIALRSLCQTPELPSTLIWIDAICIDQQNTHEKGQQVALMGEIYSGAETVLIWLGEADDSTPSAIQSLYRIVEFRKMQEAGLKREYTIADLEDLPAPPHCDWASIRQFFSARWFGRTWVLQECKLARRALVHRGKHIVPWEIVGEAAEMIRSRALARRCLARVDENGTGSRGAFAASTLQSLGTSMTGPSTLVALLFMNTCTDCTEPRDRIFAHLGLLARKDSSVQLPAADYTSPLESIYTAATRAMIDAEKTLYPVTYAPSTRLDDAGLRSERFPSWVPRYDRLSNPWNVVKGRSRTIHTNAVLPAEATFSLDNPDILCATGVRLGDVTFAGPSISSLPLEDSSDTVQQRFDPERLRDGILAPWDAERCRGSFRSNADAMKMATLLSCGQAAKYYASSPRNVLAEFVAFLRICSESYKGRLDASFDELLRSHPSDIADAQPFLDWIPVEILGRRYFETGNGFKGIGTCGLKVDDVLCILFGCEKPLILRQRTSGWEIIGIAYVQGMMEDDDIQTFLDDGWLEAEHYQCFEIH